MRMASSFCLLTSSNLKRHVKLYAKLETEPRVALLCMGVAVHKVRSSFVVYVR
ncbi:hypothetical protein Syun_013854 [Stephania yunnanensis]|uniref:Uncharacterized protein n=1 Tax=Stephania yunnanensis TaxID=152371 RepID=A0AAP0JIM8_9MAGN